MHVIPAVDLKDGQCVRLEQGDMERVSVFSSDPVEMARRWEQAGAAMLHVVDLSGAVSGEQRHREVIGRIARALNIPVQIGGGVRTGQAVADYVSLGVSRVILGTVALRDRGLLERVAAEFPGKIVVGVDARSGRVAVQGWTEDTEASVFDVAASMKGLPLASLIYTDISRDGMQTGVDLEGASKLIGLVDFPVILAGGVSTLDDIRALRPVAERGLWGVITGRALYAGTLDLTEALAEVSAWAPG